MNIDEFIMSSLSIKLIVVHILLWRPHFLENMMIFDMFSLTRGKFVFIRQHWLDVIWYPLQINQLRYRRMVYITNIRYPIQHSIWGDIMKRTTGLSTAFLWNITIHRSQWQKKNNTHIHFEYNGTVSLYSVINLSTIVQTYRSTDWQPENHLRFSICYERFLHFKLINFIHWLDDISPIQPKTNKPKSTTNNNLSENTLQ